MSEMAYKVPVGEIFALAADSSAVGSRAWTRDAIDKEVYIIYSSYLLKDMVLPLLGMYVDVVLTSHENGIPK